MALISPYRILIGPVFSNYAWLGSYLNSPQVKTFSYVQNPTHPVDILYTEADTCFSEILAQLPADFVPDAVIWWDPVYHAIPPGIADCPFPTAVVVWDWNLGYSRIHDYLLAFDYILADRRLAQVLELRGLKNYGIWSSFAFNPDQFYLIPDTERLYDILFVGNLHHFVHPQRSHYLERIARLRDRFHIKIADGVQTADYCRLLNQSKITFNYGICQVANMRTYEVPACGSLLFMEEENLEIRDILTDRDSCVLYNTHNLESLLTYYLTHPAEREAIANNGHQKIQTFTLEKQFERLLALVPEMQRHFHPGTPRAFARLSGARQHQTVVRQQYFSQSPLKALFVNRLSDSDGPLAPNVVNAQMLFWLWPITHLQDSAVSPQFEPLLGHATVQLNHAYQVERSPIVAIHLAWLATMQGNTEIALSWYHQTLARLDDLTIDDLPLLTDYWLSLALIGFDKSRFITEWERISYEQVNHPIRLLSGYGDLLKWFVWQNIGALCTGELAKEAYHHAISVLSCFGEPYSALGQLYHQEQNWDVAVVCYLQAIACNPLFVEVWVQATAIPVSECLHLAPLESLIHKCLPLSSTHPRFVDISHHLTGQQFLIQIHHNIENTNRLMALLENIPDNLPEETYLGLFQLLERATWPKNPSGFPWGLSDTLPVCWISTLLEPLPQISHLTGFVFTTQPSEFTIERCYDRLSDVSQHQMGPDIWPFQFPSIAPIEPLEIESDLPFYILIVCEQWADPATLELISQTLLASQTMTDTALYLWHPVRAPSADEMKALAQQLDENSPSHLTLLIEPLSPEQQGVLLKNARLVMGLPIGTNCYYLWWCVWLGTPVGFWTPHITPLFLYQIYPFVATAQIQNVCFTDVSEHLLRCLFQAEIYHESLMKIQSQIRQFYGNNHHSTLLRTLWQMKTKSIKWSQ